jgi:putative transport protein
MLILLFLLLALGALASKIRVGSLYLGSLGALLVGIGGGAYGIVVPQLLIDVGVLFLIFVIGAQAGPRFLRVFRREGLRILIVGGTAVSVSTIVGIVASRFFLIDQNVFLGAMTGGLSSAAALAALLDSFSGQSSSNVILGYSASYPLSTILVLLIVPVFSFFLRSKMSVDETEWIRKEPLPLERKSFLVTNKSLVGKSINDIEPIKVLAVNLSRITRNKIQQVFSPKIIFELGDIVTAVGEPRSLHGLEMLLGEDASGTIIDETDLISSETYLTSFHFAGKSVQELEVRKRFGITITRVRRDGVEFLPKSSVPLEFGDQLVFLGAPDEVKKFTKEVNPESSRLNETELIPLILGLAVGVLLGSIPVSVYGSMPLKLGSAGGVFLVSMFLGYVRGIGKIRLYLPIPASNLIRDLGLLVFIVGTGTLAGKDIEGLLSVEGRHAALLGGLVTVVLLATSFATARIVGFDSFASIGLVCGAVNASSALPRAGSKYLREVSALFYASLYPVTLILKVIVVQLLKL